MWYRVQSTARFNEMLENEEQKNSTQQSTSKPKYLQSVCHVRMMIEELNTSKHEQLSSEMILMRSTLSRMNDCYITTNMHP